MKNYGRVALPAGRWAPNGKGTLEFIPDRRRTCQECGADTTFAEDSRASRCHDCQEQQTSRHELITDELAALFEDLPDDDRPICARPGCHTRFERAHKTRRYCSKRCGDMDRYWLKKGAA